MTHIWTVSELAGEIDRTLQDNFLFQNCWVSGEISNFKHHLPSGHWYFTLKDDVSSLRAVMFRSRAVRVRFEPRNGMQVLVRGNVKLYDRDGNIQVYAEEMQPAGLGELYLAFEQLKERLIVEGLFAEERKKKIPLLPQRVGIVTSTSGAALRDILQIIKRRHPRMSWVVAPAAVQGEAAPREIVEGIRRLNRFEGIDVLIVGRGGGSLEELWAFNTEEVARAIAASRIPVISAVGHETDMTIADYVADLRAPTPSAAAELAVPLLQGLKERVDYLEKRLQRGLSARLAWKRQLLERLALKAPLRDPFWRVERGRQELDDFASRLQNSMTRFMADKNGILKLLAAKLDLLSPLSVLERGYSLTYDQNGQILRSAVGVTCGAQVQVRLAEGRIECRVVKAEIRGDNIGNR